MELPANLPLQALTASVPPGILLAGLKLGDTISAQIGAQSANGQTLLLVGGRQLPVTLPSPLAPGTQLTLQVQQGPKGLHLVVISSFGASSSSSQGLPSPATNTPPAAAAVAPTNTTTMLSAVALSAVAALGNQGSVAVLVSSLMRLGSRVNELPPQVRAAIERFAAAIPVMNDSGTMTTDLRQAIGQSGVFLEASLSGSTASTQTPTDMKALLLLLRGTLSGWLGIESGSELPGKRPPPPIRGAGPRAISVDPAQLPQEANREAIGRLLLGRTDAALSRLHLLQLASLPGQQGVPAAQRQEWQVEVPFILGHDAASLNMQIFRDGHHEDEGEAAGKAWHLRFALNASVVGEVGADVALLGSNLSIVIWADRAEIARAMHDNIADLSDALTACGLGESTIRVRRHNSEVQPQAPAGSLLDRGT